MGMEFPSPFTSQRGERLGLITPAACMTLELAKYTSPEAGNIIMQPLERLFSEPGQSPTYIRVLLPIHTVYKTGIQELMRQTWGPSNEGVRASAVHVCTRTKAREGGDVELPMANDETLQTEME